MKKEIVLIDPVGKKAGMDAYSLSLLNSISNSFTNVHYFSNCEQLDHDFQNVKTYNFFKNTSSSKILRIIGYFYGFIKSLRVAKKIKPDALIIHYYGVGFNDFLILNLIQFFNLKLIAIVHDVSGFVFKDIQYFQNAMFEYATKIVVHNDFSKNELEKLRLSEAIRNKIRIIKHGGFIDLLKKEDVPKDSNYNPQELFILFFGQIKEVKGLDILLKAMPYVNKNIKLIIAGKPWHFDFSEYDKLISELKLEDRIIKFIQFISNDLRDELFKKSCLIILPYKRIYASGVLLTAMSHGKACLVSNLQPLQEIITHNYNGFIFEQGNPQSLATEINLALKDSSKLSEIEDNSFKSIKNEYNWKNIGKEWHKLFID